MINAAVACAEAIGMSEEALATKVPEFEAHCGSGGHSVRTLLSAISQIQKGWMLTGITRALAQFRKDTGKE